MVGCNLTSTGCSRERNMVNASLQVLAITMLIALAIFGNTMMFFSIYRAINLRTVTNYFTINLAITDFSVGVIVLPVLSATILHDGWVFPKDFCPFIAFLTVALLLVSITTLAGASLDRYFCICHPLTYPMKVTTPRVMMVLVGIWIQGFALASGPLVGWGEYQFRPITIPMCSPLWNEHASYASILLIMDVLAPLGIMVFSYIRIIQAARRQMRQIEDLQMHLGQGEPEKPGNPGGKVTFEQSATSAAPARPRPQAIRKRNSLKKNVKTLKTVFIVVGTFFFCWAPYILLNLWSVNNDNISVPYWAELLVTCLAFSNSSLNPYIFALLNREFRYAWIDILRKVCHLPLKRPNSALRPEIRASRITIMEFSRGGNEIISVASIARQRNRGNVRDTQVLCTLKISQKVEARVQEDQGEKEQTHDVKLPGQVD